MAVIDAHTAGILALDDSIGARLKIWSGPRNLYDADGFPDEFADGLVAWDCLEDLSVIPPSLAQRFERLFQEFRTTHPSVTSYYRHQWKKNGQSGRGGRIAPATPPTPPGMRLRTGRFQ